MKSGLRAILEHSGALSDYEALESTAVHYWVESGFPEPQHPHYLKGQIDPLQI